MFIAEFEYALPRSKKPAILFYYEPVDNLPIL
jgi:hypothetical protein